LPSAARGVHAFRKDKLAGETMHVDLTGRTALVTGASSGFGRHFCQLLARSGAEVIAAARRTELLDSLDAEITATGGKARALRLDVADQDQVIAALSGLERLDIAINNAGVASPTKAIDMEAAEWRGVFDVNVNGAFFVAREAARIMRKAQTGGSIINIASITGLRTALAASAYAPPKAAVIHMTKTLAMEWARFGVRVNAITPGYIETDLNREFLQSAHGEQMRLRIPQRRFGEISDLDGPLLLLASDASRYMTGSVLEVDGGHLASPL
jgi:NAD(P)-dependent dehydrogenase (short-subunit alcohol dehydrogenase family)